MRPMHTGQPMDAELARGRRRTLAVLWLTYATFYPRRRNCGPVGARQPDGAVYRAIDVVGDHFNASALVSVQRYLRRAD